MIDAPLPNFGPRGTDKDRASFHWTDQVTRQLELQYSGDETSTIDFTDDSKQILPAGSLILSVYAYSVSGGAVTLTVMDEGGATAAVPGIAPAANSWAVIRDIDLVIAGDTQISGAGLAAGEDMKIFVNYLHPAVGEDGVLDKPRSVNA